MTTHWDQRLVRDRPKPGRVREVVENVAIGVLLLPFMIDDWRRHRWLERIGDPTGAHH